MTVALGRRREAHATLFERIAFFGTSGYGCHHGAMRLLVVCAVRQTGFLSRMMPPSELDPFLDAANISAAFSLLGLDACDQRVIVEEEEEEEEEEQQQEEEEWTVKATWRLQSFR
eukprot:jgi/Tetstr1/446141/TSEL_033739.t1